MKRHTLLHRLRTGLRDTRGANLVEAAIMTPLLLLLTFSIFDFGALFYCYLSLQNGVSIATRYAVTGQLKAGKDRASSIRDAMRNATPTLTIGDGDFAFSHLSPGGAAWVAGVGGPNDIEKVTVNYTWELMTPLIRPFFTNGEIQISVESSMKNEGVFN